LAETGGCRIGDRIESQKSEVRSQEFRSSGVQEFRSSGVQESITSDSLGGTCACRGFFDGFSKQDEIFAFATQTPKSQNPEFRSEKIIGRRLKQVNEMREFPVAGDGLEITGLILQLLNSCNS
jgi:hypothetical protein